MHLCHFGKHTCPRGPHVPNQCVLYYMEKSIFDTRHLRGIQALQLVRFQNQSEKKREARRKRGLAHFSDGPLQKQNKMFLSLVIIVIAFVLGQGARVYEPWNDFDALKHRRERLLRGNFPDCADFNEGCGDLAAPQIVDSSSAWAEEFNVWSDKGFCNIRLPNIADYMMNNCERSCGFCESQCIDEYDEVNPDADEKCEDFLASEPDACKCPENGMDCAGFSHGEIDVLFMRNWCQKTCFENGNLPHALPCFDSCSEENHPCPIPFNFNGNEQSKCISLKKSSNKRPFGAYEHGTSNNESELKWCPTDGVASHSDKNMDWAYCSCIRHSTEAPTLTTLPTLSPTSLDPDSCQEPTHFDFFQEFNRMCGQALTSCIVNLTNFPEKDFRLCAGIQIKPGLTVSIVDANEKATLICIEDESRNIFKPSSLFSVKQSGYLILNGVSVKSCRGVSALSRSSSIDISKASITNNMAEGNEGVVFIDGFDVRIFMDNVEVSHNLGEFGGVIHNLDGAGRVNLTLKNSRFTNNTSTFNGGVLQLGHDRAIDSGSISIVNCQFSENKAVANGGVFMFGDGVINLKVTMHNSTFSFNEAEEKGAILALTGADSFTLDNGNYLNDPLESRVNRVHFISSSILNSKAAVGGVVSSFQNANSEVIFEECSIENSHAENGGVADIISDYTSPETEFHEDRTISLTLLGGAIRESVSSLRGGVVVLDGSVRMQITGTLFENNFASQSGGVFHIGEAGGTQVRVDGAIFKGNTAGTNGGMMNIFGSCDLNITDAEIKMNLAGENGGAIYAFPATFDGKIAILRLFGTSLIARNKAEGCGGAINLRGQSRLQVKSPDVRFGENEAGIDGGAICMHGPSDSDLYGAKIYSNFASRNGGAVFLDRKGSAKFEDVEFSSNQAQLFGGAIAIESGASFKALGKETSFEFNQITSPTKGAGGAMAVLLVESFSPDVSVSEARFLRNDAVSGPDIFVDKPEDVVMKNTSNIISLTFGERGGSAKFEGCEFEESTTPFSTRPSSIKLYKSNSTSIQGVPTCENIGQELSDEDGIEIYSGKELPALCVVLLDAFGNFVPAPEDLTLSVSIQVPQSYAERVEIPKQVVRTLALTHKTVLDETEVFALTGNHSLIVGPNPTFHPANSFYYGKKAFEIEVKIQVLACPVGEVLVPHSGGSIAECFPSAGLARSGRFFPDPTNLNRTELCPVGTHRPLERHALECYPCPLGFVSVPDRSQCNYCSALFALSWDSERESCDPCPEGAFCLGGERVVPEPGFYHSSMRAYQFHKCLTKDACDYAGRSEKLKSLRASSQVAISNDDEDFLKRFLQVNSTNDDVEEDYRKSQCAEGYEGPLCGACSTGYQRESLTECRKCNSRTRSAIFFALTFCVLLLFLIFTVIKTFKRRDATSNAMKIIVAFIQQVSMLSTFRIGWPKEVSNLFAFTAGISSGEINSIGCLFDLETIPSFVLKAIVTIYIVPFALMILIPSLIWCVWKFSNLGKRLTIKPRRQNIVVMIIIIYFFLYPFIVVETVKLFACVPIDDISKDDPYTLFLLRPGQYLLVDTLFECWKANGWHQRSAIGIGIPSLILFVLGLPLWLAAYLMKNRHKFHDADFEERFGFIYIGVRRNRWFWFFAAMVRTSVLAVIGMLVADPGYQNLVAQLWLVLYIILVLNVDPYQMRTLLNMEVLSTTSTLFLLHLNMWMLQTRENTRSAAFNNSFSVLIILTVTLCFSVLLLMASFALVAVLEEVNPSDLTVAHVLAHFQGLGERTLSFVKRTLGSMKGISSSSRKETHFQQGEHFVVKDDGSGEETNEESTDTPSEREAVAESFRRAQSMLVV